MPIALRRPENIALARGNHVSITGATAVVYTGILTTPKDGYRWTRGVMGSSLILPLTYATRRF